MAVSIAFVLLLGLLANYLMERIKLPGLLGMLFVGILCGPYALNIIQPELLKVSADLRMAALIVILLRAGLELRKDTLNRVGKTVMVMSCVPALFEGVVITLLAPLLLDITYLEAAILGSIIAAVSPAVVVPLMLNLIDERKGAKKGIPTLILSASAIDDVFVIVVFTILLGMYSGSNSGTFLKLLEIPESIILGIIIGVIGGYAIHRIFERFNLRATKMTLVIISTSILLTWLEEEAKTKLAISSLLGVMTIGFVLLEKSETRAYKISQKLAKVWIFAEILLFVLVGAQVNIKVAVSAGVMGAALICVGLAARSVGTYLSVLSADLNLRERMFCVISYIPKATVQAAIGAVPLEMGVRGGEVILAVAVLSILLTAPLGAIGISIAGRRWLK
ncbi:MAG: potassium transporter [bacterium]|nr:MAG: potassium transporter [bacterium]